jgi:O-antigen/teichoic acid export membrane protein
MDAEHTRRRLWRGAGFGVIAWAGPLLLSIALTPTIVRGLGDADYGLYALVTGLVTFSSTALLGRAVVRRVAAAHATDALHAGVAMVRSAMWLASAIGLAIAVLLWSTGNWLAFRVFHLPGGDYRIAFGLVGAGIAAAIVSQVFSSVLHGLHRFDLYARIVTITSVAASVGCAILAARGFGALALVVWTVIVGWIGCVLYIISARRLLAGAMADVAQSIPQRGSGRSAIAELLTHGSAVAVYQICGYALVIAERALVVRTLGVETLTYYVVAMNLAMPIHGLIAGSTLAVLPTASAAEARQVDVAHVYLRSSRWANMAVVWLTLTIVVCADAFLRVWMGDSFADQAAMLLRVHALSFGILGLQVIAWQVAEGWGLARLNAWFTVWWLATALLLMPALGAQAGAAGVALARFAGLLAVPVFIAIVERRVLGSVQWRAWLAGALGLAPAAVVAGVAQAVMLQQFAGGWSGLAFSVLVGAAAYIATLYVVGFVDGRDLQVAQWLWRGGRAQASS